MRLSIIERGLITIYETDEGQAVVKGSELYEGIGAKTKFRHWMKRRIEDVDLVEGEDFYSILIRKDNGIIAREYIFRIDAAKEIAMIEKSDVGKKYRGYFIEVEKRYLNMKRSEFGEFSLEFKAIMMLDKNQQKIQKRISKLENNMTINYEQQKALRALAHTKVRKILKEDKEDVEYDENYLKVLKSELFKLFWKEYREEFVVQSYKNTRIKDYESAIEFINNWNINIA